METRRRQLRDDAAAHIRKLIITGALRPDDSVPLATIADEIDVSLTPVREALLLLVQDGWMIQEPNRGFRVAPVVRSDVRDAYLVNQFVVGELAARAAEVIAPADVARLYELDEQIRALDGDGPVDPERLNYELHDLIYGVAESPRLRWFAMTASRLVPRDHWTRIEGWTELNRAGHRPIIRALERHDAERARKLMASHMQKAGALLLAQLDRTGFWADPEERGSARNGRRSA
jgi:DNA-binding GntR family transcriptional regulator